MYCMKKSKPRKIDEAGKTGSTRTKSRAAASTVIKVYMHMVCNFDRRPNHFRKNTWRPLLPGLSIKHLRRFPRRFVNMNLAYLCCLEEMCSSHSFRQKIPVLLTATLDQYFQLADPANFVPP